jgi:hypothetical protein
LAYITAEPPSHTASRRGAQVDERSELDASADASVIATSTVSAEYAPTSLQAVLLSSAAIQTLICPPDPLQKA